MTITHNGKEYEVDIERAINSNLATPSKDNARTVHNGEEYHVDIQNAIRLGAGLVVAMNAKLY